MKTWITWLMALVLIVAVAGFIGWRITAGKLEKPIRTVTAQYQTIVKDVAFTGSVTAQQRADLAFELTGNIQSFYVNVGDSVVKGQKLALLNPESVELELAKAQADAANSTSIEYLTWQKTLEDLKNTKVENTRILEEKRQAVRSAKAALDQSREVFNAKTDESGDESSLTKSTYSTVVANENAYKATQKALQTSLQSVQKLNAAAQKSADIAYAQYVSTAQTSTILERLAQAKAAKSVLRTPFNGVITKKSAEIGELASAGKEIFTVETVSAIKLTSEVPETDALTLTSGMNADVTFDALPSQETISTTIASIDPAATIIQGVPTFQVTLSLLTPPAALRPGLTSNIVVHVAKKEHVLGIPRRAVIVKNGEEFVKIQKADTPEEERKITTGLVGSDGTIEITSGLSEGEVVITP